MFVTMQIECEESLIHFPRHWQKNRTRRGKSKVMEQIDLFLEGMGLYRKQTARDATCLFRAVSEQIFYSQCFHYSVRLSCIHFMERNRHLFPAKIDGEKFEDHSRRLRSPREWGGHWEMQAMAILYKRDFIVFNDINTTPVQVTDNNFPNKILLCQIGPNHFDSVFSKSFIDNTAVCQALIYELLYGQVFGMVDIDTAIHVMLYEGKQSKEQNQVANIVKESERPNSVINVLARGGTPFPYKVAKALDPRMYRNVEFDLWNDERKEMKKNNIFHNEILQIGSKCMVTVNGNPGHQYPAYIQDMQPDKGPVSVFVEVLGERRIVPYESIEPIVLPLTKTRCICINGQTSGSLQQTLRFRRCKQSRFISDKNVIREISTEKIICSPANNVKIQPLDLNNNQLDNQLVVWSHNTTNDTSITASVADTSTSSFESNESGVDSESTPAVEQPYYVMTSSSQWGIYPSVPPCPPPQVPYAYGPPAVHVPTPVYVTFSDGTTMVVPSHRTADNQQVMYYDPSAVPTFAQHYSVVGSNAVEHHETFNVSMEQQMMHHRHHQQQQQQQQQHRNRQIDECQQVFERVNYDGQALNMMQIPPMGYWTDANQLVPAGYCPPQMQCSNPQMANGEMAPVAVYFSPQYPAYQISA